MGCNRLLSSVGKAHLKKFEHNIAVKKYKAKNPEKIKSYNAEYYKTHNSSTPSDPAVNL